MKHLPSYVRVRRRWLRYLPEYRDSYPNKTNTSDSRENVSGTDLCACVSLSRITDKVRVDVD